VVSFDVSTPSDPTGTWRIDLPHVFGLYQEYVIEDEAVRSIDTHKGLSIYCVAMQLESPKSGFLHPVRSSVILSASSPQFDAEAVSEDATCLAFLRKESLEAVKARTSLRQQARLVLTFTTSKLFLPCRIKEQV